MIDMYRVFLSDNGRLIVSERFENLINLKKTYDHYHKLCPNGLVWIEKTIDVSEAMIEKFVKINL